MIAKNCAGRAPVPAATTDDDKAILELAYALPEQARAAMQDFALHLMLGDIWKVVAEANRYFAGQEPWARRKDDPERMGTILYVTAEVLRVVAIMAQPAIPEAASKLLDLVGAPPDERLFAHACADHALAGGSGLPSPKPVFPRYVEPEEMKG